MLRGGMLIAAGVLSAIGCVAPGHAADVSRSDDTRLVIAVGIGRPPEHPASDIQARLMAERAALLHALRNAARDAGRAMPPNHQDAMREGTLRVGATLEEFRITRVTRRPDGVVEVEVTVPAARIHPQ